jgi:hypothetical protein
MKQVILVEWTELLRHSEKLGFKRNYAHELLRVFQGYDRTMEIECIEIENIDPMTDTYIGGYFKDQAKDHGDLDQMGRDIVYDFMQKHKLSVMTIDSSS